jgi:rubrerythrin
MAGNERWREMTKIRSVDDLLNYAIARETEAHRFYMNLAKAVKKDEMREILEGFAAEEAWHKEKLEAVKAGELSIGDEEIGSLGITDRLPEVKPAAEMNYVDALALAMKKEKAAYTLYSNLALVAQTQSLRQTLEKLAQEEAYHKLRLEIEYDWETF